MNTGRWIAAFLAPILLCSVLTAAEEPKDKDSAYLTGDYTIDGYWLLSGKWMGYMGIALRLDKDQFQYWFYSDVRLPNEPTYPIVGTVQTEGDTITLKCKERLYDSKWHLFIYRNQICLLADLHYQQFTKTGKLDDSRLLYKIDKKRIRDEKKPQMNAPIEIRE
jgi:hypothetical protein